LLLPVIKRITKKKLLILIGLSWLSEIYTSYLIHSWGGITTSETDYQYSLKVWANTLNPAINISFLLIGIGLKKGYINILNNKLISFMIIFVGQTTALIIGHDLLFLWPPILWAIFSLSLNWTPNSMILKKVVNFVGQRTYGIFFIHFILLEKVINLNLIKQITQTFGLRNFAIFSVTFITSAILSELTWRYIESPFIKISKKFINR
jgi:peptidoglycan/LPS O-acetylase OafA/YrhL